MQTLLMQCMKSSSTFDFRREVKLKIVWHRLDKICLPLFAENSVFVDILAGCSGHGLFTRIDARASFTTQHFQMPAPFRTS